MKLRKRRPRSGLCNVDCARHTDRTGTAQLSRDWRKTRESAVQDKHVQQNTAPFSIEQIKPGLDRYASRSIDAVSLDEIAASRQKSLLSAMNHHRRQTRNPGWSVFEYFRIELWIGFNVSSQRRSRPDESHVTFQHVEELWQFVKTGATQNPADLCDPLGLGAAENALFARRVRGMERSDLVEMEGSIGSAHSFRRVQERAPLNGNDDTIENRKQQ